MRTQFCLEFVLAARDYVLPVSVRSSRAIDKAVCASAPAANNKHDSLGAGSVPAPSLHCGTVDQQASSRVPPSFALCAEYSPANEVTCIQAAATRISQRFRPMIIPGTVPASIPLLATDSSGS